MKPNGISERNQIKISDLGASFLELVEILPEIESRLESKSQEELSKIGNFQGFVEGSRHELICKSQAMTSRADFA